MYAFNKRRGTLMPPVTYNTALVLDAGGVNWTGNYSIQNLEDVPVKFTAQQDLQLGAIRENRPDSER